MIPLKPRTLATKFVLIVALGAVLPLALVGMWLTRSAERSGSELLRSQLTHAADAITAEVDRRWTVRDGELHLLAGNTVAVALLRGDPLSSADSVYLLALARSLSTEVPSITYIDADGRERWSFVQQGDGAIGNRGEAAAAASVPARAVGVELPVTSDARSLGKLVARVNLASVTGSQVGQTLVPGGSLTIAGVSEPLPPSDPKLPGVEVISRVARAAPLRVIVSAPSAAYVEPFEHAARLGVGVLLAVALTALLSSVLLASRLTGSLQRLSEAATAVAAGDLQRSVDARDDDEVGQLARAFNAMTESLRRTLSELASQRALAAVGEFAASLSHEVRNSLTAVRVDLQHARRHLAADEPGTQLVTRALDSVRRLDAAVTGALRVARSGQVARTKVDLGAVLQHAMRSAEPVFAEHGATLEPLTEPPRIEVDGDAAALEQLFLNLLINAAQASPHGGESRVEIEPAESRVVVRVIDAGGGIPASVLSEPATSLRTTKEQGTGLGLPIARRIAAAHGGELTFEPGEAIGTTAVVRLPRVVSSG